MSEQKFEESRRATPRGYLEVVAATFLTLFALEDPQDTVFDEPLGDQVELPKEFLEAIAQTAQFTKNDQ